MSIVEGGVIFLRQRSRSTTETSTAIFARSFIISDRDQAPLSSGTPLELQDVIVVETNDGEEIEFEVVAIVEDDEGKAFAVCYAAKLDREKLEPGEEAPQPFIVTNVHGQLVRDPALAQAILDDFLLLASQEEGADEDPSHPA
jgi:hypothetical protein